MSQEQKKQKKQGSRKTELTPVPRAWKLVRQDWKKWAQEHRNDPGVQELLAFRELTDKLPALPPVNKLTDKDKEEV